MVTVKRYNIRLQECSISLLVKIQSFVDAKHFYFLVSAVVGAIVRLCCLNKYHLIVHREHSGIPFW